MYAFLTFIFLQGPFANIYRMQAITQPKQITEPVKVDDKPSTTITAQIVTTNAKHQIVTRLESPSQNTINCVRFSPNGKFLAIACDANFVVIYEFVVSVDLATTENLANDGKSGFTKDLERWTCYATFQSHGLDVCSISWSPDSTTLASGSFDNQVCLYSVKDKSMKYSTISNIVVALLKQLKDDHKGPVKCVAFDPIGIYLFTQVCNNSTILTSFFSSLKRKLSRTRFKPWK